MLFSLTSLNSLYSLLSGIVFDTFGGSALPIVGWVSFSTPLVAEVRFPRGVSFSIPMVEGVLPIKVIAK